MKANLKLTTLPKTAIQFEERKGPNNFNRTMGAKSTLDRRNDCDSPLMMAEESKSSQQKSGRKRSHNGRKSVRLNCETVGSPIKTNRVAYRSLVKEEFTEAELSMKY